MCSGSNSEGSGLDEVVTGVLLTVPMTIRSMVVQDILGASSVKTRRRWYVRDSVKSTVRASVSCEYRSLNGTSVEYSGGSLLYGSVTLNRASSSLGNLGLWVLSSKVDSSLRSYHKLSTRCSRSVSLGSFSWRIPCSFRYLEDICIP